MSYELLSDLNVLDDAFNKCKKGVTWKASVQKFEANKFAHLNKMRKEIESETYKQAPFYEFDINERGKQRHIKSLMIYDRVLQRALCDAILEPTFYKYLIYDNGASVKGKGVNFARERLKTHLQKYYRKHGSVGYVLLLDFSKFFDSIPHDNLVVEVAKHIDDNRTLALINNLVNTFEANGDKNRSLGIGSQISQILGIYYLTRLDNYVKIVKGIKYYGRYMDDLYVIHHDKKYLKGLLQEMRQIIDDMGLSINEKKTQIYRIDKGFTYLKIRHVLTDTGYVVKKPCRKNTVRERRKLKALKKKKEIPFKDIEESYKSWRGGLSKYNSHKTLYHMDNLFNQLFKEELRMKNAKVLSQKEVKDILAEHFGVKPEDVISTKYSYIITESEDSKDGRENIHD